MHKNWDLLEVPSVGRPDMAADMNLLPNPSGHTTFEINSTRFLSVFHAHFTYLFIFLALNLFFGLYNGSNDLGRKDE
jgi:hypothetical protein